MEGSHSGEGSIAFPALPWPLFRFFIARKRFTCMQNGVRGRYGSSVPAWVCSSLQSGIFHMLGWSPAISPRRLRFVSRIGSSFSSESAQSSLSRRSRHTWFWRHFWARQLPAKGPSAAHGSFLWCGCSLCRMRDSSFSTNGSLPPREIRQNVITLSAHSTISRQLLICERGQTSVTSRRRALMQDPHAITTLDLDTSAHEEYPRLMTLFQAVFPNRKAFHDFSGSLASMIPIFRVQGPPIER